jgi:hypothetical protein
VSKRQTFRYCVDFVEIDQNRRTLSNEFTLNWCLRYDFARSLWWPRQLTYVISRIDPYVDSAENARIDAAMAQLDSQKTLNYVAAARAFGTHPMTLARRYKGKPVPRAEANSTCRQRLNNT